MSPTPTGHLVSGANGTDLVITRRIRGSIDDVWASITESERTARWFASWTGEAHPGATIRYTMTLEDGAPSADMTIVACEPPHGLEVTAESDYGSWHLAVNLIESGDSTELTFVHHGIDGTDIGAVAPGWEYYLDGLLASRDGATMPDFDDYYPGQRTHFEGLRPEGGRELS